MDTMNQAVSDQRLLQDFLESSVDVHWSTDDWDGWNGHITAETQVILAITIDHNLK